ncbi:MAG TPA: PQQ-binding-like beta-propeller repeat protein, partial [Chloroflexota bacterium]|nr:PQQ-binding-like beta-propeller repeat protein [Chloroflexota bacterium]
MLGAIISLLLSGSVAVQVTSQADGQSHAAASGPNTDWSVFGSSTDNTRYSPLNQITTSNVNKLGIAWTAQEGKNLTEFETTPVVVKGVMYYTTSTDQVRAVNPATGKLLWQYTPSVNFYLSVAGGGGGAPIHRGVTVVNGVVYLTTFNDQLIALQSATGEKLWEANMAPPSLPYSNSSPVTYWNGMVFAGSEEGDAGLRGYIAAFDAKTGKQIWKFYTVPPAGQGWMPKAGNHGGGDVWMPVVIDSKTGILYAGTGNPSPDFQGALRPGCDQWVNATVALDARTGKLIWGHSEFCNDWWDYDSHQPPMLIDVTQNGKTVRMVEHGNKSGKVFFYAAKTGKVLATTPYLGQWTVPHLKPNPKGVKVCPGTSGGIEYSPPSYSPQTQLVYQQVLNECEIFQTIPIADTQAHKLGTVDTGGSVAAYGPISGDVAAIDPTTGKVAWKDHFSKPCMGGSLTTAGGLLFAGCDDGHFRGFDAKTGKVLWDANLGLGLGAAPMTYEINGTQYIAIATGGNLISPGDNIP